MFELMEKKTSQFNASNFYSSRFCEKVFSTNFILEII